MKVVLGVLKIAGIWLILLVVGWADPSALRSDSWGSALLLAFALQAAGMIAFRIVGLLRFARPTFAVWMLAWAAAAFTVPAAGLRPLAELLDGVDVTARWPGYLIGALAAAQPLGLFATKVLSRPFHGAACAVGVDGETLVAVGHRGGRIGLFEPATGLRRTTLGRAHRLLPPSGLVRSLCEVRVADRPLLAAGGDDGAVRLWDPATGQRVRVLTGHRSGVLAVCALGVGDRALLASGSEDGTVRIWDPATGGTVTVLRRRPVVVRGLCEVPVGGTTLLASVGDDGVVRLFDTGTWQPVRFLTGTSRHMLFAVCTVRTGGRVLVATGGRSNAVEVYDAVDGTHLHALRSDNATVALTQVTVGDRTLLAATGSGPEVSLWDPLTGEPAGTLTGTAPANDSSFYQAMCTATVDGSPYLVAAGFPDVVEAWDVGRELAGEPA